MRIWNRIRGSNGTAVGLALASLMTFAALGGGQRAGAQVSTPAATAAAPAAITVNGTGIVEMTPDTASVTLGVTIVDKSLAAAQARASTQLQSVIDELQLNFAIVAKDIQTANYNVSVNQSYDNNGNPGEITGYTVSNQLNVIVRDTSRLGALLESVVKKGANSIGGINFYVADQTDAAKQARTAAVKDAAEHAQQIAAAAGASVGKIVSITETYSPSPVSVGFEQATSAAAKAAPPIQTGSTTVTASLTITYELAP